MKTHIALALATLIATPAMAASIARNQPHTVTVYENARTVRYVCHHIYTLVGDADQQIAASFCSINYVMPANSVAFDTSPARIRIEAAGKGFPPIVRTDCKFIATQYDSRLSASQTLIDCRIAPGVQ